MSQILTALPALTAPITNAQAKTLIQDVAAIENLSNREVIALSIISKIHELWHNGGTDYRTNHAQLRNDAQAIFGASSFENFPPGGTYIMRIQAVIDWNAGHTADAALSTLVDTLITEMAGLRETPELTLCQIRLFLLYKLAV